MFFQGFLYHGDFFTFDTFLTVLQTQDEGYGGDER